MGHSKVSYEFSDADSSAEDRRAAALQLVSAGLRVQASQEDMRLVLTMVGVDQ